MLKKMDTCLYCGAPVKVNAGADFAYCESCGRIMEVTRFTEEERRLVQAVDELRISSERAQQDFLRAAQRAEKARTEAEKKAVQAAESVAKALSEELYQVNHRLEASEARMLRNMYVQAESAQRAGRFETAEHWYRQILIRDEGEAEVHWRLVLCRYGVEYVREQASGRFLPTICHMVVDSVLADSDYRAAIACARSDEIRRHYEHEAMAIEQILDKYRQIRATEKPYDVFISVKQGDSSGNPTKDSQIAQDLYYMIRDKLKLRVFNSRISLAEHAGIEFEPYIMAALMSAKVMLVVGTSSAHMCSPWVRNEWRRFRWLKDNENTRRRLIALLSGMGVKEIPIEMGDHQAISMDNVNAMESLRRSLQEVFGGSRSSGSENADSQAARMLELAAISMEFGEFDKVDDYCEKALYMEPKNSRAYALKLCAELHVKSMDELSRLDKPIDDYANFKKALHFADETQRRQLLDAAEAIRERIEHNRLAGIYASAVDELNRLKQKDPMTAAEAASLSMRAVKVEESLRSVDGYEDAAELLGHVSALQQVLQEKYAAFAAAEKAEEEAAYRRKRLQEKKDREREVLLEQERRKKIQESAREELRELELQAASMKAPADALSLSGSVRKLMQRTGSFRDFWDAPNLQATCNDLLAQCERVHSEKTKTLGGDVKISGNWNDDSDKLFEGIFGKDAKRNSKPQELKGEEPAEVPGRQLQRDGDDAPGRDVGKQQVSGKNISRKVIVPSMAVTVMAAAGLYGRMLFYTGMSSLDVLPILALVLLVPMLIEMVMKAKGLGMSLKNADSLGSVWIQSPWPKLALLMVCMLLVMVLMPLVTDVNAEFSADPQANYSNFLTAVSFACYSAMTFVEKAAQGRKSCLIPLVGLAFFGWNMTIYL